MRPEPIWGWISNVPSLGRCRAQEGLSQSLRWVAFITVMNALQRNDTGAEAVLANDEWSADQRTRPPCHTDRRGHDHSRVCQVGLHVISHKDAIFGDRSDATFNCA